MESPLTPPDTLTSVAPAHRWDADWVSLGGLLLLGGFAWIPDSYFQMVGWPGIIFWQVGFLLIGAGCCYRLRMFQQPFRLLGHGLDWAVLGLLLSLVFSSLAAQFSALAIQNSLTVLFYIITLYSLRNSQLPWLRGAYLGQGLVVMGAISSILSLVLWHPNPAMWLSNEFGEAIRNRFPLGHHNFSGGFFVLISPLAVGMALGQKGWRRWLNGIASLVVAVALYSSGSRGAWLGAIAMVMVPLTTTLYHSRGKGRWRALLVISLVLVLLGGILLSNPRIRNLVNIQSITEPNDLIITGLSDGPTKDRFFMAQAGLNIFHDHPLLGLGPGNLGRVYDLYRPVEVGAGLDQVQQLHNLPLQLLVELGLMGFAAYLWGLIHLLRLWWRLRITLNSQENSQSMTDSTWVSAIGLSLLGYGLSSLTDYQLENIPIAITLLGLVVMLVQLADAHTDSSGLASLGNSLWAQRSLTLSPQTRRIASLMVLMAMGLALQFWMRSTLAIALTHQGIQAIKAQAFTQADTQFYRAAKVAPWDPTPSALAAEQLVEIAQTIKTPENQILLRAEARALYQQALKAAPNDPWFNSNLAVLALPDNPELAHTQALKMVQLSPRNRNYSYYLLGLTYLERGQPDQAIEAFALESLVDPNFAMMPLWDEPDFQGVRSQFVERTLQNYETLLSSLPQLSSEYQRLYEQTQILRWWTGNHLQKNALNASNSLSLLTQALFEAESNPVNALKILNRCILKHPTQKNACQLLQAWLQPETYLTNYLATTQLSAEEKQQIKNHIQTHRRLQDWLKSTTTPIPERQRYGLTLIYRNLHANNISAILRPHRLQSFTLVGLLNLTYEMPREFPNLDQLIESLRSEKLKLPHPSKNNFQLTRATNT